MADPYATEAPDLGELPTGPAPWLDAVAERGGAMIDEDGGFDASARFLVVACRDNGVLAPVARIGAAMAVLLWLEHGRRTRDAGTANGLLGRLRDRGLERPVLAIKHGLLAGPPERAGSVEVAAGLVTAVLDAELDGAVSWEADPDFDYEVPGRVPELTEPASRAVLPRLLYADHDRVYEHAALVVAAKRRRHDVAASLPGLDPSILAAAGWPPQPSPWRDDG